MDTASIFSGGSVTSVGESLANPRVVAKGVPSYDFVTNALAAEVRNQARAEAERRRDADDLLIPHAVTAEQYSRLVATYPEYRMLPLQCVKPCHTAFEAHRYSALALCIDQMRSYAGSVTVIGNAMLQCATRGHSDVHVEGDVDSAVSIHAAHEAAELYGRLAISKGFLHDRHGYKLSNSAYKEFVQGTNYQVCYDGDRCKRKSEAMVFDLSMHCLSLKQAVSAMADSGALIASVILPYNPRVFKDRKGSLSEDCDLSYSLQDHAFNVIYPEGVAGVASYPAKVWHDWLKVSTVSAVTPEGKVCDYRLELMQYREPFMFGKLVRVEGRQPAGETKHALDMPWAKGLCVVEFDRLRGLDKNPESSFSWERIVKYYPSEIVGKLYTYALSVDQADFTPEVIIRRASKVDSRIITSGMNVKLLPPMTSEEARDLGGLIYGKAFVTRYEMGRLGAHLTEALKGVAGFGVASFTTKMAVVMTAMAKKMWNCTAGFLSDITKDFMIRWFMFVTGKPRLIVPNFQPACQFYLLTDCNRWLASKVDKLLGHVIGGSVTSPSLKGARTSLKLAKYQEPMPVMTSALPTAVETRVVTGTVVEEIVDTSTGLSPTEDVQAMVRLMAVDNDVTRSAESRFELSMVTAVPEMPQGFFEAEEFTESACPADDINETMEGIFPGLYSQEYEGDIGSMRYDPQEREYEAIHMETPLDDPSTLPRQEVFKSKIKNYAVERKPQSLQETLTALAARNLAAPAMRVPMDETALMLDAWDNLKKMAFRPDADQLLEAYESDPISFEEELLAEWGNQAKPENVRKVFRTMAEEFKTLEDYDLSEYEIMLKTDAKPPMSTKPLREVIAPQVIVMQDKHVNAMFSSIFRVLTRRFLSLLKPSWMLNLLKDNEAIRDHIAANHPWEEKKLKFLENDFGKYDKSQDAFTYKRFGYQNDKLGMDQWINKCWTEGNKECTLKSMKLGIRLMILYTCKSGGSATAYQNGSENMWTTCYAYRGTDIVWGVFMGDDSLACCRKVSASKASLDVLAEFFNLEAKFHVLDFPYFVSNFLLLDEDSRRAILVPDPVKRAQKWSVSVAAVNPQWEDKARSARETLVAFRHERLVWQIEPAVRERYGVPLSVDLRPLFSAIATGSACLKDFRDLFDAESTIIIH